MPDTLIRKRHARWWFATTAVVSSAALVAAAGTTVVAGASVVARVNVAAGEKQAASSTGVQCNKQATIGFEGPFASGFDELLGMSRLYAQEWDAAGKKPYINMLVSNDQGDPADASLEAQRFVSDSNVLAVVGPGGSSESLSAGPVFNRADLAWSPTAATADSLVNGQFHTMVNVNPHDSDVVGNIVNYLVNMLKIKSIFIVDDGEPYNTPLADAVAPLLRAKGVKVTRAKITQTDTDFSSLVTSVPKNTNVFWMLVETDQLDTMAQQLREQGNNAIVMGTDAAGDTSVNFQGMYYFSFAPDIRQLPLAKNVVADYLRRYGSKAEVDAYAPYAYVAGEIVVQAVAKACAAGTATRAEVVQDLRATDLPSSILGQPIRFDSDGARIGAKFYLYKIGPNDSRILIASE